MFDIFSLFSCIFIKSSLKLTHQNLSTECYCLHYSIITLACCDTKVGDIAKVMTGDNIRFPLLFVFCFISLISFSPPESLCFSQSSNIHSKSAPENVAKTKKKCSLPTLDPVVNFKPRENKSYHCIQESKHFLFCTVYSNAKKYKRALCRIVQM